MLRPAVPRRGDTLETRKPGMHYQNSLLCIDLEAAGIELEFDRKSNLVSLRDFGRNGFEIQQIPPPSDFPPVLWSLLESPRVLEKCWRRRGKVPRPSTVSMLTQFRTDPQP